MEDNKPAAELADAWIREGQKNVEVGPLRSRPFWHIVSRPRERRPVIIPQILKRGDLCIVTASEDSFKSTFTLEMAIAVASQQRFLDKFKVLKSLRVLVVQAEIDPGEYDHRLKDTYGKVQGIDDSIFISSPMGRFRLDAEGLNDLTEEVLERDADVIILDPLGQMWPSTNAEGEPFNPNVGAGHVVPVLQALKELRRTVILVHHDPKPGKDFIGRAAGAKALLNDPDVRIFLTRRQHEGGKTFKLKSGGLRVVDSSLYVEIKTRNQQPPAPFTVIQDEERHRRLIWVPGKS